MSLAHERPDGSLQRGKPQMIAACWRLALQHELHTPGAEATRTVVQQHGRRRERAHVIHEVGGPIWLQWFEAQRLR